MAERASRAKVFERFSIDCCCGGQVGIAEAVGQDGDLLMGNGYAEDHAAYALQVVREHPVLPGLVR